MSIQTKICRQVKKFNLPESIVKTIIKGEEKIIKAVVNAQSFNSKIIRKHHGIIT